MKIIEISTHSPADLVAGSVAALIRRGEKAELRAMGCDAVCNALDALAAANASLAREGIRLATTPRYVEIKMGGKAQIAIGLAIRLLPAGQNEEDAGRSGGELLLVSAGTDPGRAAGAIAGCIRAGRQPTLQAAGADAAYAAVKALAIAQRYLAPEGFAIAATPHYLDVKMDGELRRAVRFPVTPVSEAPMPVQAATPPPEPHDAVQHILLVSAHSLPGDLCGAIAGHVRDGRHIELQAVEPAAVNVIIRAILAARNYLAQDGIAIAFAPSSLQFEIRGEQKTAICFPITACAEAAGMDSAQERQAAAPNPIQVAAASAPHSVAGAVARRLREGERVEVRALGVAATCIAVRALLIARRYLEDDAIAIATSPGCATTTRDGELVTSICFPITAWSAGQDARADD